MPARLRSTPSATIYAAQSPIVSDQEVRSYHPATQRLVQMLEKDTQLKALLEKSIAQAAKINPDPQTNPAQNLKAYIEYVNWAETAMTWAICQELRRTILQSTTALTRA